MFSLFKIGKSILFPRRHFHLFSILSIFHLYSMALFSNRYGNWFLMLAVNICIVPKGSEREREMYRRLKDKGEIWNESQYFCANICLIHSLLYLPVDNWELIDSSSFWNEYFLADYENFAIWNTTMIFIEVWWFTSSFLPTAHHIKIKRLFFPISDKLKVVNEIIKRINIIALHWLNTNRASLSNYKTLLISTLVSEIKKRKVFKWKSCQFVGGASAK